MSALLEFECRPPKGGYDVITFDPKREEEGIWRWDERGGPFASNENQPRVILSPDANDDERYMAERWPDLFCPQPPRHEVIKLLRPRSERTKRFDLFTLSRSAFLEFAQTEPTEEGVKAFAERYGPLWGTPDRYPNHHISRWADCIRAMRGAVEHWEKVAKTTGDFSRLIDLFERKRPPRGVPVGVLLKKDPS